MSVLCDFQSVVPQTNYHKQKLCAVICDCNKSKQNIIIMILLLLKWAELSMLIHGSSCKHPRVPPILKTRYFRNWSYVEAFLELSEAWWCHLRTTCCDVKFYILPTKCVYVGLLWFLEQTETVSLHSINWLAFAMQTKCVPCETRAFIISWTLRFKGLRHEHYTGTHRESECIYFLHTYQLW